MSESEEMYLATLARLNEAEGKSPTLVSRLAEELAVLPVFVNQMIHKLKEIGFIKLQPQAKTNRLGLSLKAG